MNKLETLMKNIPEGTDAVIIDSVCNRLYYTGMHSSDGTLLITRGQAYFIIDFRYIEAARKTAAAGFEVILQDKLGEQLLGLIEKHSIKTVGIESGCLTVDGFLRLKKMLPDCEIIMDDRLTKLITAQRMCKDDAELSYIKAAQELTDKSFTYILDFIKPGMSEREIALELEFYSRKLGSEGASFDFIVVAGKNSSLPHGVPTDYRVQKGDFLTMDFGCMVSGYHSDMTRTIAIGEPSGDMKELYETVLRANRESMAAIRAGVMCRDIDKIARDIIDRAGYAGCFGHGLGHSVGIEIHEEPRFNKICDTITASGTVMTVEPGIYIEGKFGCRIEDMVYITENGCINLTKSEKELIVI